MKSIKTVLKAGQPHMVGDGFKVQNYINQGLWKDLSPFLMFDYNEPWTLLPTEHPRGVDVHPHKGFETVTIVWQGELAHEDSTGGKGALNPGDVQWMTAGEGILHKEFHGTAFSARGGTLHMAQLWVNLPAKYKNTPAKYQDLGAAQIPTVALPHGAGNLRVIAGNYANTPGAASTFTRINLWDINLNPGTTTTLTAPPGDHTALMVLSGHVMVNQSTQARSGTLMVFEATGTEITIEANNEAHVLLLGGEPIDEPIVAYGPFVMNTRAEIQQALADYEAGKWGRLE
ncbi:MAG: pirin family protein [Bacteroidetes bacterium]|nr:MAG: pirin family protein [Bacteroidota bacterium]